MSEPTRRTLDVRGAHGAMIVLDKDALRFDYPNRAPSWMPLDRVGEIRIQGPIGLGAGLIEALIRARVRVRWITRTERPIAELWPVGVQQPGIAARLDELLQQREWSRAYQLWRLMHFRWILSRVFRRAPTRDELVLAEHPTRVARALFPGRHDLHAILDRIGDFCAADARRLLLRRGWPVERLREPKPGPDLARDMTLAMIWEAIIAISQTPPSTEDRAIHWHVRHRYRILLTGRASYALFRRWLNDRTGGAFNE